MISDDATESNLRLLLVWILHLRSTTFIDASKLEMRAFRNYERPIFNLHFFKVLSRPWQLSPVKYNDLQDFNNKLMMRVLIICSSHNLSKLCVAILIELALSSDKHKNCFSSRHL